MDDHDHPFRSAVMMHPDREFFSLIEADKNERLIQFLRIPKEFDINCKNGQGLSGLQVAIQAANIDIVRTLLTKSKINIEDSVLLAIKLGQEAIVEILLKQLSSQGIEFQSYPESVMFPDQTPLMLAAKLNNYDMVGLLLRRKHQIDKPHMPYCGCCEQCKERRRKFTVTAAHYRINVYDALTSPAYISQTEEDPILTTFKLVDELRTHISLETPFKNQYTPMLLRLENFAVDLIDNCKSTEEVLTVLRQRKGSTGYLKLPRLNIALKLMQKEFAAHSNIQQVLYEQWVGDWHTWHFLPLSRKMLSFLLTPFMILLTLFLSFFRPSSPFLSLLRSPVCRMLCHFFSYLVFLSFMIVITIRDRVHSPRGYPRTGFEWPVIVYAISHMVATIRTIAVQGWDLYITQIWHRIDIFIHLVFASVFLSWYWGFEDVTTEGNIHQKRERWAPDGPTLIGEAFFAVATVTSCLRVLFYLLLHPKIGSLELTLGKMLGDVVLFLSIFDIVIVAFAAGLVYTQAPYEHNIIYDESGPHTQSDAFTSIPSTFRSLFWVLFTMRGDDSPDIVLGNQLENGTNIQAKDQYSIEAQITLSYMLYTVLGIVVLKNMLIAMITNTFNFVNQNEDVEYKFLRAKVWLYFIDCSDLPPPLNLIPTPNELKETRFFVSPDEPVDEAYSVLVRELIRRYYQRIKNQDLKRIKGRRSRTRRFVV